MRTIEQTIYTFEELPTDAAKEKARDWFRNAGDCAWMDESRQSIEAFCNHFGVTLRDWSVGAYSPIDYRTDASNEHFRGCKLRDVKRDYMPTGYCVDCSLWETFHDEFKRTGDAKGAFDSAMYAGFKAWRADLEWQMSDEYIDECLSINAYEFDENGRIF